MNIMLIGGPYDNEVVGEKDPPMPVLYMPPKLESPATPVSEGIPQPVKVNSVVYVLKEVVTSPHKWHYEYHYKAR